MKIRCRHYDEHGNPIGQGCLRQGNSCEFVHPSESGWSFATPSRRNNSFRGHDASLHFRGGRGRGGVYGAQRADKLALSSSAPKDSAWDTSTWGVQTSTGALNSGNDEGFNWASAGSGFGSGSSMQASSGNDSWSGSGWGSSDNVWGSTDWRAIANNVNPTTEDTTWGSVTKDINRAADSGSWGTVVNDSPDANPGWDTISMDPAVSTSADVPMVSPVVMKSTGIEIPLSPLPDTRTPVEQRARQTQILPVVPTERETSYGSTESSFPSESDIWSKIIKNVERLIRLEMEISVIQDKRDNWKAMQISPYFSHVGRAARQKFETNRVDLEKTIVDLRSQYDGCMAVFLNLLEAPHHSKDFHPIHDEEELRRYTMELMEWISSVRTNLISVTIPPNTLSDLDSSHVHSSANEMLTSRVAKLEAEIDYASDHLDDIRALHLRAASRKLSPPAGYEQKSMEEGEVEDTGGLGCSATVGTLMKCLDTVGSEVSEQAQQVAMLLTTSYQQGKDLAELESQNEALISQKNQLFSRLEQVEKNYEKGSKQIEQLAEKIQNLHNQPQALPLTSATPIIQELTPHLEMFIGKILENEVLPVLDALQNQSSHHIEEGNKMIYNDVLQKLAPVMTLTEAIKGWIKASEN